MNRVAGLLPDRNRVKVQVCNIRQKLPASDVIETVLNNRAPQGYRLTRVGRAMIIDAMQN